MSSISLSDAELRVHVLPDHLIYEAEGASFETIRLLSCGRYSARLMVGKEIWHFSLCETANGERELSVCGFEHSEMGSAIWRLAWHRAAERMLAVRQGHLEYRHNNRRAHTKKNGRP